MKFNLRTGNYAQAGKAAADDAVRSQIAARKNSVDYGKMAQQAQTIRSEVKRKGIEAGTSVATAGLKAAGSLKAGKIKSDAETQLKKDKRFAGVVSAAGQVTSKGIIGLGEKPAERRDSSDMSAWFTEQEQEARDKAQGYRDKLNGKDTPTADTTSTDTSDNNTGGNSGGKDTSAGATATPAPPTCLLYTSDAADD